MEVRTFTLDMIEEFFTGRVAPDWIRPLREAVISTLGGIQGLARRSFGQADLVLVAILH